MEKLQLRTTKEINKIINAYPTKLRRNWVAITTNTNVIEDEITLGKANELLPEQHVIAVGDLVKDIKPGDKVVINIEALLVTRYSATNSDEKYQELNIKLKEVDGYELAIIDERVIEEIYK